MRLPRPILLRQCRTNNIPLQSIQWICPAQPMIGRTCLRWNSNSSSNVKLPAQIPTSGAVNLSSLRALVDLHGPDAAKFLQGLITKIFPSETEPNGLFTSFLSPQVESFRIFVDVRDEFFSIPLYILLPPRWSV